MKNFFEQLNDVSNEVAKIFMPKLAQSTAAILHELDENCKTMSCRHAERPDKFGGLATSSLEFKWNEEDEKWHTVKFSLNTKNSVVTSLVVIIPSNVNDVITPEEDGIPRLTRMYYSLDLEIPELARVIARDIINNIEDKVKYVPINNLYPY